MVLGKRVIKQLEASSLPVSEGLDPPSEKIPEPIWINVNGRKEHEAMLRDNNKMNSLGLDPAFEKMVYLRRWGSWLNGCTDYSGKK